MNGGLIGDAFSAGETGGPVGYQYLFGGGQGAIERVNVDHPGARSHVFDEAAGTWVIVAPTPVNMDELEWSLLGPGDVPIFEAVGHDPRD